MSVPDVFITPAVELALSFCDVNMVNVKPTFIDLDLITNCYSIGSTGLVLVIVKFSHLRCSCIKTLTRKK